MYGDDCKHVTYMYMYMHVQMYIQCIMPIVYNIIHMAIRYTQSLHTCVVGVIVRRAGVFGEGFGRVHLDNLTCNGSENRLQDCPHSAFEEVSCQNFESDVGVICPGTCICTVHVSCTYTSADEKAWYSMKRILAAHALGNWSTSRPEGCL